ncbi:MAG: phosphatidylserine decarboxylase, partial [Victivallales bacterium]|nr:phosphatidylserine decarboxylase [Victivallales bacterium]
MAGESAKHNSAAVEEAPRFYNRERGCVEYEKVLGDKWLRRAYCSPIRGLLRWPLFGCSLLSRLMGCYLDSAASRKRIAPTVAELGINMDEAIVPEGGYASFNDFFCRALKPGARPLPAERDKLISPADCRLTVYPEISGDTVIPVKGAHYSVRELLGKPGNAYADAFRGGSLMVCRLCPADYHRFHFPDNGRIRDSWLLAGKYHSVNPLALHLGYQVFTANKRHVSMLELEQGGLCAFIPVGAFGVSGIHLRQPEQGAFSRGDTAGHFTFGGSTVIVVFTPG